MLMIWVPFINCEFGPLQYYLKTAVFGSWLKGKHQRWNKDATIWETNIYFSNSFYQWLLFPNHLRTNIINKHSHIDFKQDVSDFYCCNSISTNSSLSFFIGTPKEFCSPYYLLLNFAEGASADHLIRPAGHLLTSTTAYVRRPQNPLGTSQCPTN